MYEILLTRIFSVTMWYHFAFLAISVALFGMTAGAIAVYVFSNYFTVAKAKNQLTLSAFCFAVTIVLGFLTHLCIPFAVHRSLTGLLAVSLIYLTISVPFFFSGICICIALTKFPRQLSKLYAVDLAGAAFGCVLLLLTLSFTDAVTAVFVVSFLAAIGTLFFSREASDRKFERRARTLSIGLLLFAVIHTPMVRAGLPLVRLMWVKGSLERLGLYERWNSFSRIRVTGDPNRPSEAGGWGLSPTWPAAREARELMLTIDAGAATVLTAFNGDLNEVEHLKYDIVNAAHYLRDDAKVLVVGVGGGRDILSALAFHQSKVVGVEINENIINALNQRFGEFAGHLDRDPRVNFIHDEARSYLARTPAAFDIIQVSLIDTWAATAAGAFVLTENSLYTLEAWRLFYRRLTPHGILTFSRWYFQNNPAELYRLASLARAALQAEGIAAPQHNIAILLCNRRKPSGDMESDEPGSIGVGTILVSKQPLSLQDLEKIERLAQTMQFEILLSPHFAKDETLRGIVSGNDWDAFAENYWLDITPPTDDRPFFFQMLPLQNFFQPSFWKVFRERGDPNYLNLQAVLILLFLLVAVIGLTLLCIIGPLWITRKTISFRGSLPFFLFFVSIGLGFMLVEISQLQRLIVFLGHPTYGLSVVLFSLLLSSGLGSFLTNGFSDESLRSRGILLLGILLLVVTLFGLLTPLAIRALESWETVGRLLVAGVMLWPLGLFLGMAFPLGMRVASVCSPALTPWFWGINGASSVCASVLATAIALSAGISAAFWTGLGCYLIATVSYVFMRQIGRP